jgi:flagellar biosynthetic protein FliQ
MYIFCSEKTQVLKKRVEAAMDQGSAMNFVSEMFREASAIAFPFLVTTLVVGLIVSVLQVATQIQEMTLTFVPKIVAAIIVVLVMGAALLTDLSDYATTTIRKAAEIH